MRVLQNRRKRLYLPAISILTVVLLLLVLISVSTYRNLDRQEKTVLNFVHQQGLALLGAIEAGVRAGMTMPMWQEDSIRGLIRETAKNEDVAYIYLIDSRGKVVHHSKASFEGMSSAWQPHMDEETPVRNRVRNLPDNTRVYDLAKRFTPRPSATAFHTQSSMMRNGRRIAPGRYDDLVLVLGLKMTAFDAARRSDIHHAIIMATIVVALGSGALFFIFVIQNYYLVDRTLKQTQDYTRQVVANMANGLLSIDLEGRILSFNLLALDLLGLEESEVKGLDLKSFIDFSVTGIEKTLLESRPVLEREYLHRQPSGQTVPMTLSVTPILNQENTCSGAVMVLRDLREIKRLEAKVRHSEKLAAIGKLAAGVAHEVRNPLSSIRGFARFLAHSLNDRPKEKEYAEIMVKEVDRINRVVNDLLTFARPLEPDLAPTDVAKLVEHAVRLIESDARLRNVTVDTNVSEDLDDPFLDANQMTQALLNLTLNALQEVGEQGTITIGAEKDETGSLLHLWVADDGPGISRDKIDKIFDPFFTTRETGTGLGLSIVHKIVENHGGEIRIDSPLPTEDRGCRFTMILPVVT